jgi:hypothetical protein
MYACVVSAVGELLDIGAKVLKDGDLVEVDANRGIVKIIKKAAQ